MSKTNTKTTKTTKTTQDIINSNNNHINKEQIRQQKIQKAVQNNFDENNINIISSNKGEVINKKSLVSMSNEEVLNNTINDISQQLQDSQNNELQNQKNINSYLFNNDNKAFHLEMIKRVFKGKPSCIDPNDFTNSALQYFQQCNKYNKMPTLSGVCLYAGVPYSTFQGWIKNPQDLFHNIATTISDYIHDLTLEATIDKNLDTKLFNILAQNSWSYKAGNTTTNIGVIVNQSDLSEEEKQNRINALRISSSNSISDTHSDTHISHSDTQQPYISN